MKTINRWFLTLFERYMPDPLVLAALISVGVFIAGMLLEGQSPAEMANGWYDGFFNLHKFAMQIILIMVTGYAIARSPAFEVLVERIAVLATTPSKAIILVTLCTLVATWLNWGVGMVIGAILARQLARKVPGVDYRVLIAGAYSGFIVWHGGLSGAATLVVATEGNFLQEAIGGLIPVGETIFSGLNLLLTVVVSVVLISTLVLAGRSVEVPVQLAEDAVDPSTTAQDQEALQPSDKLERSRLLSLAIGLLGLGTGIYYFATGGGLNIDSTIFLLMFVGILLHGSLRNYLAVVTDGVRNATGVVIQFPFYAGIMGMMAASGMSSDIAGFFVDIANEATLPVLTFFSAGLINILVPSGGGQWAIQGPIVIEAAQALGADPARSVIGFVWGDAWTNMIQPFWALPALAIAGLKAKDIMGICAFAMMTTGIAIAAILFISGLML